jgi:hypothetical protein
LRGVSRNPLQASTTTGDQCPYAQVLPVPLAADQVLALTSYRNPDKLDEVGSSIALPMEPDFKLAIETYLSAHAPVLTVVR